jgi:hypothetical protein
MRSFSLSLAALTAFFIIGMPPSHAQNGSWCTERPIGSWGFPDCSYQTQQQCLATASGTRMHCTPNVWYQPEQRTRAPRKATRHRKRVRH